MAIDLLITGSRIVDGTGAPAFAGDLAIADGRFVAVGERLDVDADRVIDASGLVSAPGFIDVHTHLDAQVFWDPMLSVSSWHGVTTVVMGNCGYGFAPTHAPDREVVMRTLEMVEGMDFECLREGLGPEWGFETFPEYLAAVDRARPALNVATLVPHSLVRLYVMGTDAIEREATPAEVDRMRAIVDEAMDAGAIGFSTSTHPGHAGYGGSPVPSRLASFDEHAALAAVAGARHGVFMPAIGPGFSVPQLCEIHDRTGATVSFASISAGMGGRPDGHVRLLQRVEDAVASGRRLRAQIACNPITTDFSLAEPFPFTHSAPASARAEILEAVFADALATDSLAARRSIYDSSAFHRSLREATSSERWMMLWNAMRVALCPQDPQLEQRPVMDLAAERDLHPADLLLDLAMASDLEARFSLQFLNSDENEVARLISSPATQIALSDAGAHVSQLCDAGFTTYLLSRWVRDVGLLSLEAAVHKLTDEPATLFGIPERGRIANGFHADVVVFDPGTVGHGARSMRQDLPARASRIVVEAIGIEHVIVNGVPIRSSGRDVAHGDTPSPGQLLRVG